MTTKRENVDKAPSKKPNIKWWPLDYYCYHLCYKTGLILVLRFASSVF